jgi:hypothetical protein
MSTSEPWTERLRALWRRPLSFTSLVPVGATSGTGLAARIAALAPALKAGVAAVDGLHTFRLVAAPPEIPGGAARPAPREPPGARPHVSSRCDKQVGT